MHAFVSCEAGEIVKCAMFARVLCGVLLLSSTVYCQIRPDLEHNGEILENNSYIHYNDISTGSLALKCTTTNLNCCDNPHSANWKNETGRIISEKWDNCLYVTRDVQSIFLNHKVNCIPSTSGLRRCDIPDSSGNNHSLYVYIDARNVSGTLIMITVANTNGKISSL